MSEQTETAVARRHPFFFDLDPLRSMMDRLFGDTALQDWPRATGAMVVPTVDITETDDEYRIRAEIPDVSKSDVNVELEEGLLTIRGDKKSQRDEKAVASSAATAPSPAASPCPRTRIRTRSPLLPRTECSSSRARRARRASRRQIAVKG